MAQNVNSFEIEKQKDHPHDERHYHDNDTNNFYQLLNALYALKLC